MIYINGPVELAVFCIGMDDCADIHVPFLLFFEVGDFKQQRLGAEVQRYLGLEIRQSGIVAAAGEYKPVEYCNLCGSSLGKGMGVGGVNEKKKQPVVQLPFGFELLQVLDKCLWLGVVQQMKSSIKIRSSPGLLRNRGLVVVWQGNN
ncbi:MAG: hypothetical protein NWR67_06955, partial [Saprospiraceae bacterium]|nr:hypothetical protein [Saprospiraceae bacterium]